MSQYQYNTIRCLGKVGHFGWSDKLKRKITINEGASERECVEWEVNLPKAKNKCLLSDSETFLSFLSRSILTLFPTRIFSTFLAVVNNLFTFYFLFFLCHSLRFVKVKVLYRATFSTFFLAVGCRKMISLYLLLRIEPLLIVVEFLDLLIQTVSINFYTRRWVK